MKTKETPWWLPVKTDAAWLTQIRADYEDKADWPDGSLIEHFADGQKYATLWDHTGDAYDQFEKLADAYFSLLARVEAQQGAIDESAEENKRLRAQLATAYGYGNDAGPPPWIQ